MLRALLHRKVSLRDSTGSRTVTILEAILTRMAEDSLKGSTKSAAFLLNRYAAMVSGELQPTDLGDDDREVLEAFTRKLKEGLGHE